jgi:hypothetical protein
MCRSSGFEMRRDICDETDYARYAMQLLLTSAQDMQSDRWCRAVERGPLFKSRVAQSKADGKVERRGGLEWTMSRVVQGRLIVAG